MSNDTPNGWQTVDVEFHQQLRAFQRNRDGLVLSVEQGTTSWKTDHNYAVNTLPRNFYEDTQIIDQVGTYESPPEAMEAAREYMIENPR